MPLRHFARLAGALTLLSVLGSVVPSRMVAQGSDVDIIVGTIRDKSGNPVAGAKIEATSIETDVTRTTTTKANGTYLMQFYQGGGQYRITVSAIGHTPYIANVTRQSDDDRINFDVTLGEQAIKLQDLVTTGDRRPNLDQLNQPGVAASEHNISGEQAMHLPIDASDLSMLAALAPGVIFTAGTDSTNSTFSVAGQSAASNSYVVDGVTTTNTSVPQDAVRNTRVITNTYDVSRGGFAGGQVSVQTRGGSNRVQGSISSRLQDRNLAWGADPSSAFNAGQTQQQIGAGFGGPLKRNKTFLFGSFQFNRSLNPIASLDLADNATLSRLGASPDSVAKFISLVNATGLTQRAGIIDPNRTQDRFNGSVRFDWNLGQVNILTLSTSLGLNSQEPQNISSTQLPQVGGNTTGHNEGLNFLLASRFGRWINQFRTGLSYTTSSSDPYLYTPSGRVTVQSTLDSGQIAVSNLGFGGNSGLPRTSTNRSAQVIDELSFLPGAATHHFVLGLDGSALDFNTSTTSNQNGTYTYATLADFANNVPSSFTRTLQPSDRTGTQYNASVYLSDAWRPRSSSSRGNTGGGGGGGFGGGGGGFGGRGGGRGGFGGFGGGSNTQFQYGVRVEHTSYAGAPALNQAVYDEFGVRTDRLPSETYISPRVGFSYAIASREQNGQSQRGFGPPAWTFRGGLGVFRGTMPSTLPGTAAAQSGLAGAQTQINCVGGAVPTPDWNGFLNDPSTIPTECINNASTPIYTGTPTVTTYAANYGAPKTERASLGLTRRITNRITFNIDASYVRGIGQAASKDLNLNQTPKFRLGGADGRPVYADPTQIDTVSGQVPLSASRVDPNYGAVSNVFSSLENETKQVTFNLSGTTNKQMQLNLAYTYMRARDQGGSGGGFGGGFGSQTAGDPNVYTWATSGNQHTHNIQATVSWPITPAWELTTVGRITSGSPYTPVVAGDINGDGSSRNDQAFIYNPATTADTAVANGMNRLLNETSGNAKKCLEAQLGAIASRNSCVGPWSPSLDLQLNWRPSMFQRRLQLSLSSQNLLGGLDQLVNGVNNLKGWGGNARPDNTLLTVTGFNPTTNQFQYVVNERFGNTSAAATSRHSPFQLLISLRYAIGYDPRTMQIQSLGRNGTNPLQDMLKRLRDSMPNLARQVLARKDSLVLTRDQVTKLTAIADSADARLQPLLQQFQDVLTKMGTNIDYMKLAQQTGPIQQELQTEVTDGRDQVRQVLTDVQWSLLPDSLRNPPRGGFNLLRPGGRGGPGGAGAGGGRGGRGGGD